MDKDLIIAESDVSVVYDAPYSPNYTVESKLDSTRHIVNAYTRSMNVLMGWVNFEVWSKKRDSRTIGRPFHFLTDSGVLLALKRHKHQITNAFALNHELFALAWDASFILHFIDGKPVVFASSRQEWLSEGRVGELGEELQVSLEVPDMRLLPEAMVPMEFAWWVTECKTVNAGMG